VNVSYTKQDTYGQKHPTETPELIKEALMELDVEINKLPAEKQVSWEKAKEKCAPELVDDAHKLVFLRCEIFHVDLAASRLLKYWDKRIELYGEEKAFLPLTLKNGASKDDLVPLRLGIIRYLPNATDETGRAILLFDPSKQDNTKYDRATLVRAIWYVVHAALADSSNNGHKKGVLFMGIGRNLKFNQFDRQQVKMNADSIKGCLPIRVSAFYFCHPPAFFHVIFPVVKLFIGPLLRKRIRVQAGSDSKVLESLESSGIPRESVPVELGGDYVFDHLEWLQERMEAGL